VWCCHEANAACAAFAWGAARSRSRVITASKFERSPSRTTGGQGDQPLTCVVVLNQRAKRVLRIGAPEPPPRKACSLGPPWYDALCFSMQKNFGAPPSLVRSLIRVRLSHPWLKPSEPPSSRKSSVRTFSAFTRGPAAATASINVRPAARRAHRVRFLRFSPALALTPRGPPSRSLARTPRGWRENASRSPRPDRSVRPPCAA